MDNLRPLDWNEYIGQERIKRELAVRIESAVRDDRRLDHILLEGPPGAGKTSLAEIIAEKIGEPLEVVTMPISEKALIRLVLDFNGIVLLDEIHRCTAKEQEMLLPLLEFDYVQDKSGRRFTTEWLTCIGATTERQKLIGPLIERFDIAPTYEDYTDEEMSRIAMSMAVKAGIEIDEEAALAFGIAATGTPRRVRQFIIGFRDLSNTLDRKPTVDEVLDLCSTERDGLTVRHLRYIETLYSLGGSRGLSTLVSVQRISPQEAMEIENLLINKGLLVIDDRGRSLTSKGIRRAKGDTGSANPRNKS